MSAARPYAVPVALGVLAALAVAALVVLVRTARGPGRLTAESGATATPPAMAGPGFGPGLGDDAGPARIFAKSAESCVAVTLVWQQLEADGSVSARLAVAAGRNVAMTQPFDPEVPPPAARKAR